MAAIPTILKGDQPDPIAINLASGFNYSESTLHISFKGVEKVFTGITAGSSISLSFTSDETSRMDLGAASVKMWLSYASGRIRTIPSDDVRIKVTDSPSEVYNVSITIRPATLPDDATDSDSLGDLKAKYNALKAALSASFVALFVLVSSAASISGNRLNDIPGDAVVVTNVSFDGLATLEDLSTAGSVTPSIVTNIVNGMTGSIVIATTPTDYTTTNAVKDIVSKTEPGYTDWVCTPKTFRGQALDVYWDDDDEGGGWYINIGSVKNPYSNSKYATSIYWDSGWDGSEDGIVLRANRKSRYAPQNSLGLAVRADVSQARVDVLSEVYKKSDASAVNSLSNTVNQWTTYWDGDDVRVTITNYYGSLALPSMYLEQKMSDGGSNYFKTVWNELTRWNDFLAPYRSFTNSVNTELANKADRAWGFYDSHSGAYAPDGYTWLSSTRIAVAAGMAYQRTVTSEGAVWVLESNGLETDISGVATNGFFRVSDDEGNNLFEIVKGNKRTVGATAGSVTTHTEGGVTHLTIGYSVESGEHPVISVCTGLSTADWKDETSQECAANVTWSGSSGAWVAEVWGKSVQPSLFVKASYEVGGETYIKNTAPVSMDYLYLGGQKYRLGTASISGNTVLTLTPSL